MVKDDLILSKNLTVRQKPILTKGHILIKGLILTKDLKINLSLTKNDTMAANYYRLLEEYLLKI